MAERTVKAIQVRAASDTVFAAATIKGLMGPFGAINFDQITKTKTIQKLLGDGGLDLLDSIAEDFKALIIDPTGDEKAAAMKRQLLADYLVSTVRSNSSRGDSPDAQKLESLAKKILALLVHFGFFTDPSSTPPLSHASQEMFRSRVMSCLNILMGQATASYSMPYEVIAMIHQQQEQDSRVQFVIELDEIAEKALDQAWRTLKKISKKVCLPSNVRLPCIWITY